MNLTVATPAMPTTHSPLRVGVHLLVAGTISLISPFTGLAWPFALVVGIVLGSADVRAQHAEPDGAADTIVRSVGLAGGILAMLFFGAIIGGIVAFAVVALAAFSERAAADASPTDRGVARILLFVVPLVMWFVVFPLLGLNVDISIGG